MRIDLLSIFPDFFTTPLNEGIVRRAILARILDIGIHNIREHATGPHRTTDDRPYGGGEGMVMKAEPLAACLAAVPRVGERRRVILMSPRGLPFSQGRAQDYARGCDQLILLCGRYEGVDERFTARFVDEECSIGDYVLSGGELAALVVVDAVCRLLPGALGCADSAEKDSFSRSLLKHHQYTRPPLFAGMTVPGVLLSGDHAVVERHRFLESVRLTLERRPDLLAGLSLTQAERKLLHREGLLAAVEAAQRGRTA